MSLTKEELTTLSKLLDEVLDIPEAERDAWLVKLSDQYANLRPTLHELLTRHVNVETDDFLRTLPKMSLHAVRAKSAIDSDLHPDAVIGAYRLVREIGRGGMSSVWLAERVDGVVKRKVALKLPFVHLHQPQHAERLIRERDILAELTHPNIARLYDAGASENGRTYLALEFVEGLPFVEYCDAQRLDVRRRLQLMLQALEAVAYAHNHLVIHRDLKPSNILVTREGQVRLLDFGIAKLLPSHNDREAALTEIGKRAMTPDYAAPELITGAAITTATDVYSVGVVLYELLTGERPYRLQRNSLGALEDAIVGGEPIKPSRAAISSARANDRNTTESKLRRQLSGDLDTIVLKALKKNPGERYTTIDAMLLDLQRYLRNEPVQARPDRSWYRIAKFVGRHKIPAVLAGALMLAVVGGFVAALWGLHTARAETARAEAAKSFLVKVFSSGKRADTGGKNITASEILERGSQQIDVELKNQPALLGELHGEIAGIYSSFGSNADKLSHAKRAVALFEQSGQTKSDAYFNALFHIADGYKEEEHWPEARAAFEKLRAAARAQLGPVNDWEARALEESTIVESSNGHLVEAQDLAERALAIMKSLHGEKSAGYVRVLGTSEQLYLDRGRPEEALQVIKKLLALAPSVPEYGLEDRLMDRYMLGSTLYRLQRFEESAKELRTLVPDMENNMGLQNDRTVKARNTLALDLKELGELKEALEIQRHNLDLLKVSRIADTDLLYGQQATLTRILGRADRFEEAIPIQRSVVAYYDQKYPTPTYLRELFRFALGDMLVRSGNVTEGLRTLEQSAANMIRLSEYRPDAAYADVLQAEGNAYRLSNRAAEASATLAKACDLYRSLLGDRSVAALRCRVYQLLAVQNNASVPFEEFSQLRDRLNEMLPPHQALRAELVLVEAAIDRRAGKIPEATRLAREGAASYVALVGVAPSLPLRGLH